ncbi:MAG TPA: Xaa-Pro peptidase family protein [bacterium]|nr:Xaa-Pro peptidase family protein [bacterium]
MRHERVLYDAQQAGVDALIVLAPANTYYVSGFRAITYSRPVLVVVTDHPALIIPELEESHARLRSAIRTIRTYSDMALGGLTGRSTFQLAIDLTVDVMRDLGLRGKRVGFEPTSFTVDGHAYLTQAWGEPLVPVKGLVERLRTVKDEEELHLIRVGCELAEHGMRVEVDDSVPGTAEVEIMARGNAAMLELAARRFPDLHITSGSRPVSGEKSVLPHSIPSGRRLQRGDVVIHGTGCVVEGYYSEDERTIFVGPPTSEQRRLFDVMARAQQAAVDAIRPGVKCQEIDRTARGVIEQAGYGPQFMHRTGHGIGIDIHEAPYFSASDETVLRPGMVMSVEPGIYVDGVGGFRHSDTIIVTESGADVLTKFPKTLAELVVS